MFDRHILSFPSALAAGAFTLALAASAAGQIAAHDAVVELPNYVVSSTRTPQDAQFTTSSVDVLPLLRLETAQISDLRTALATIPGVTIVNSGAPGGQSSIFVRGAESDQTLFLVDGVPMNSRSAGYNNFLGAADLGGLDRVEVLRGPQSTLYGSAAMGGVIFIDSARGCGPATGSVSTTFGSFETLGASASVRGGAEKIGYSASLGRFHTDNDHAHNGFDAWSAATRVEGKPAETLLIGATFRGQQGDSDLYVYGPADTEADNYLGTAYAEWSAGKDFASRVTYAQHQRRYTYNDTGAYPYTSEIRDRRGFVDWQNTWSNLAGGELVAGASYEHAKHRSDAVRTSTNNRAAYLGATLHPATNVAVNVGVRHDDFETFGSARTWRAGVAWNPWVGTRVHASAGTGFSAPSNEDIDGNPAWGILPNAALKAERSTGWDFGVEQKLLDGALIVDATYFHTRYRDRITWTPLSTYTSQYQNIGRARSEGVETAATWKCGKFLTSRLAYTYLEARNVTAGQRLARRPRHAFDAEVTAQPAAPWIVGVGVHFVADRVDTYSALEDYTTVRLFTSYEVVKNLLLKLRLENALDEHYQEAAQFDALPLGVFGGIEWKF